MGIFDWLTGDSTQIARATQITTVLNKTISTVMTQASTAATGSVVQDQTLVISGVSGSIVSGINMQQTASVNLVALQDASVNSSMRADLVNQVLATLQQQSSSGFPEFSGANTNSEMRNTVSSIAESNLSSSALASLSAQISQKQSLIITGIDKSIIDSIALAQKADIIGQLVNKTSSAMASELLAKSSVTATQSQSSRNFLVQGLDAVGAAAVGVVDSVGNTIKTVTSLSPFTLIVILIAIIVSGYVGYYTLMGRPIRGGGHGSAVGMQTEDTSPYVVSN